MLPMWPVFLVLLTKPKRMEGTMSYSYTTPARLRAYTDIQLNAF